MASLLLACKRREAPPVGAEVLPYEEVPAQEFWSTTFYVGEGGRPRAIIDAPYMANFETVDSTYTLLTALDSLGQTGRVEALLFTPEGDSSATLTANRLYYDERQRSFRAEGRVIVETKADRRLETEQLTWLEFERQINTPGFVRLVSPTEEVLGYGLEADEDLVNYTIRSGTQSRLSVTIEDEEDVTSGETAGSESGG